MHRGAFVAAVSVDHVTPLCADHVGLEGPGWLCKLPECLMAHAQLRDLEAGWLGILPERWQLWVMEVITMILPGLLSLLSYTP